MDVEDFVRIFRCDGAIGYALVGFVLFSILSEAASRLRRWDSYLSRLLFAIVGATGFLIGGTVYLFIHGHCRDSAGVISMVVS